MLSLCDQSPPIFLSNIFKPTNFERYVMSSRKQTPASDKKNTTTQQQQAKQEEKPKPSISCLQVEQDLDIALAASSSNVNIATSGKAKIRQQVTVDPMTEIIGDPRDIKELYLLAHREMNFLHHNIQELVNLEVLWLNNNKLTKLDNLIPPIDRQTNAMNRKKPKGCIRIKALYAHHNKLESVDLADLKFLQVLVLHHNRLRDLESVIGKLKHLMFLEQLGM